MVLTGCCETDTLHQQTNRHLVTLETKQRWILAFALCFPHHSASCFPLQDGTEGQPSAEEEEARKIAEMGKPILGEHSRLEVVIEESYEFKVLFTISFILFLFL